MPIQTFNGFPRPIPDSLSSGNVKSVQRGETTNNSAGATFTATISNVDITKSVVIAHTAGGATIDPSFYYVRAVLTNPTTITFTRGSAISTGILVVEWQVVEFFSLKSLQTGTTTLVNASATTTTNISSVNPNRSLTFFSRSTTSTTNTLLASSGGCTLTNATTLTFRHAGGSGDSTFYWQVIELF